MTTPKIDYCPRLRQYSTRKEKGSLVVSESYERILRYFTDPQFRAATDTLIARRNWHALGINA